MNNDPIRSGYMNEGNRMDITVTLHGSAAKPLSDHATFSADESYARGLWANGAGIPPITDTGQQLTHTLGGNKLLDNSIFEELLGVRTVTWTGTTGDHRYNGVTGKEIEFGLGLSGEQRVNIDLKVEINDYTDGDNYSINVNYWGLGVGAHSYLKFDGLDPNLDLQYHDYNYWKSWNNWDFNFVTNQIRIKVDEELLSEVGLLPTISFVDNTNTDPETPHIYIIGTLDNEELTSTDWKEVDLTDGGSGFGDLVHDVSYNIVHTIYDLAGNSESGNLITNVTYDVVGSDVFLTYSREPTSVLDVSGTFTITADFIEGIRRTPKIAIDQPGATDLGAVYMIEVLDGDPEYLAPERRKWTYDYPVISHEQLGYDDGTAEVTISNATDNAGNSNAAAQNATFIIDTTPPIFSSNVGNKPTISKISDLNYKITVTFTDAGPGLYNEASGPGALETTDFVLSIAGGEAKFEGGGF